MSGALNRHKYWRCPFFKWDGVSEVSCEGGRMKFPTPESANAYMNRFCAGDWKHCTVAAALVQHYEEDET